MQGQPINPAESQLSLVQTVQHSAAAGKLTSVMLSLLMLPSWLATVPSAHHHVYPLQTACGYKVEQGSTHLVTQQSTHITSQLSSAQCCAMQSATVQPQEGQLCTNASQMIQYTGSM